MGVVYRARQEPIGRPVALKMILAGAHAAEETVARFVREGTAAGRLRHPNVVQVYEFAEHEGLPYYTMELVEGESLEARLRRGPLAPREAAELVRTLARAVEFAHRNGVLHRDLKPGNVLLSVGQAFEPDSSSPVRLESLTYVPKVADFGLAKLLDAEGQTQSNALLGTPPYMAPEQAEGRHRDVGPATDVWALGAILYECLTGSPPFRGETPLRTLELVRLAEPEAPSSRRREVPAGLDHICLKCLEKAPARRYPSAGALADDLERWLAGERPLSTPPWWRRVRKALRRRAAVVCLGLALVGGAVAIYSFWPEPHPQKVVEEPPLERINRELDAGGSVTLIGKTGMPAYFRWLEGGSTGQAYLADADGAFTIHSRLQALVELLPDPRRDRYRFSVQVRHIRSDHPHSNVGLFFVQRAYPGAKADIRFFMQVAFNDVVGKAELFPKLPPGAKPPGPNTARMFPRIHSDEDRTPYFDSQMSGVTGPPFKHAGQNKAGWRDLEVIVTPEKVTARWEGKPVFLVTAAIQKDIDRTVTRMRGDFPRDPFVQRLQPAVDTRGSLGVCIRRGSASFRFVTVTPFGE
jgi:serine/threonine-protein kinase